MQQQYQQHLQYPPLQSRLQSCPTLLPQSQYASYQTSSSMQMMPSSMQLTSSSTSSPPNHPRPPPALSEQPPLKQFRSSSYDANASAYYQAYPSPAPWAQVPNNMSMMNGAGLSSPYGAPALPPQSNGPYYYSNQTAAPHPLNGGTMFGQPPPSYAYPTQTPSLTPANESYRYPPVAAKPPTPTVALAKIPPKPPLVISGSNGTPTAIPANNEMYSSILAANATPSMTLGMSMANVGPNGIGCGSMNFSCHQCHTTYDELSLMFCTTQAHGSRKRRCRKKYCHACLTRYYGAKIKQLLSAPLSVNTWQCPACLLKCTCVRCRKERDEYEPPGSCTASQTNSTTSTSTAISVLAAAVKEVDQADDVTTSTPVANENATTAPCSSSSSQTAESKSEPLMDTTPSETTPIVMAVKKEPGLAVPALAVSLYSTPEGTFTSTQTQNANGSPNNSSPPSNATNLTSACPPLTQLPPQLSPTTSHLLTPNNILLEPNERCVYILRGLPGSGKSYLASSLISQASNRALLSMMPQIRPSNCVCSADFFFVDPVTSAYHFDSERANEAHAYCMTTFLQALSSGITTIIVDNSNIHLWEYRNYALLAAMYQYQCVVYEIVCENEQSARVMNQRQTHGVPLATQLKMWQQFEPDAATRKIQPMFTQHELSIAQAANSAAAAQAAAGGVTTVSPSTQNSTPSSLSSNVSSTTAVNPSPNNSTQAPPSTSNSSSSSNVSTTPNATTAPPPLHTGSRSAFSALLSR